MWASHCITMPERAFGTVGAVPSSAVSTRSEARLLFRLSVVSLLWFAERRFWAIPSLSGPQSKLFKCSRRGCVGNLATPLFAMALMAQGYQLAGCFCASA